MDVRKAYVKAANVGLHSFATLVIAVLLALPSLDWTAVQMFWHSYSQQGMELDWYAIALQLGLSACTWALLVIGYRLVQLRRTQPKKLTRLVKQARGTVATETLIVLVPFLLLTSGLGQLSMLTITGMLADLAVFQAARAVFVWHPETTQPRYESAFGAIHIKDRARTIASMALAPTAPNDYYTGRIPSEGSSDYYRRQRSILVGAFRPGTPGTNYNWSGIDLSPMGAWGLAAPTAEPENLTYFNAFDGYSHDYRAARKMTQAEWGLWHEFTTICPQNCDTNNANQSGVDFTYWYNIIFPWFGYIWGDEETVGGRTGYYSKIRRRHLFPSLPIPS